MKDVFDASLFGPSSQIKKGCSFLIANVGKTVAIITLAVTALVSFTEISFSDFGKESFTSTLIMMLIASYVMYFSLEDAGEKLGRDGDGYKRAKDRFDSLRRSLKGEDVPRLRKFCLEYADAELKYRRSNLLFSLGYTEDEYERYEKGERVDKKSAKALRRVKKIKRSELNAASLISGDAAAKSEIKDPRAKRLLTLLPKLVPSTVCMLFTVSVMVSVKDNLTAAGALEALLKLSTLPIIGLKGYSCGYEYVNERETSWLETKATLIESFLNEGKD